MKLLFQYLFFTAISLMAFACDTSTNNATDTSDEAATVMTKSPVEQKWDEMMVIHDEIMPVTSKLVKQQKQLTDVPNAEPTIQMLADAEEAMWDWMNNLKQKGAVLEMEEAAAMEYLDQELATIENVRDQMTNSMAAAADLLEEAN
ncbi:MAG: hypothetical protein AAGI23_16550 [Bacteroidota bacterium]